MLREDKALPTGLSVGKRQMRSFKGLRPKKRLNPMSSKHKAYVKEKKAVYELMKSIRKMVCTGCGRISDPELLQHSHIIPVSRWKEGEIIIENITYHCSDLANGCHSRWETHNPNHTKGMLDYDKNMKYISSVDVEYYHLLISKLPSNETL